MVARVLISFLIAATGLATSTLANADHHGAAPSVRVGGSGINVADIPRSEKFYTEVFGMTRVFRYPPDGDNIIEVGLTSPGQPGLMVLLARVNDDAIPEAAAKYGRLLINTNDANALGKRASDRGSTLRHIDLPGPNSPVIIYLDDPDGYQIELYQAPAGQ